MSEELLVNKGREMPVKSYYYEALTPKFRELRQIQEWTADEGEDISESDSRAIKITARATDAAQAVYHIAHLFGSSLHENEIPAPIEWIRGGDDTIRTTIAGMRMMVPMNSDKAKWMGLLEDVADMVQVMIDKDTPFPNLNPHATNVNDDPTDAAT